MDKINPHSGTWAAVSVWARQELKTTRGLLESEATLPADTPPLRARIKLLKRLLELPNQDAPTRESEVAFGIDPPTSPQ